MESRCRSSLFPFMQLPAELQLLIVGQLKSVSQPRSVSDLNLTLNQPSKKISIDQQRTLLQFALASRSCHELVQQVVWDTLQLSNTHLYVRNQHQDGMDKESSLLFEDALLHNKISNSILEHRPKNWTRLLAMLHQGRVDMQLEMTDQGSQTLSSPASSLKRTFSGLIREQDGILLDDANKRLRSLSLTCDENQGGTTNPPANESPLAVLSKLPSKELLLKHSEEIPRGHFVRRLCLDYPATVRHIPSFLTPMDVHRLLAACPHLKELDLSHCEHAVNDFVLYEFSKFNSRNLTILQLAGCRQLTDEGLHCLTMGSPRLREVSLESCSQITSSSAPSIASLKHLQKLNVAHCPLLTDTFLQEGVTHCQELTSLNLSHCKTISDSGLLHLNTLSKLCSLNMSELHRVTDLAMTAVLKHWPALEDLSVEKCSSLTNLFLLELAKNQHYIRRLNLTFLTNITDDGILNMLSNNEDDIVPSDENQSPDGGRKALFELFLGKCNLLTDISVISLAHHCPQLVRIYLAGCRQISDVAIQSLCTHCHQLQVLSNTQQ